MAKGPLPLLKIGNMGHAKPNFKETYLKKRKKRNENIIHFINSQTIFGAIQKNLSFSKTIGNIKRRPAHKC